MFDIDVQSSQVNSVSCFVWGRVWATWCHMSNSARRYYQLNRQKYDSACWRPKLSQAARDLPVPVRRKRTWMDMGVGEGIWWMHLLPHLGKVSCKSRLNVFVLYLNLTDLTEVASCMSLTMQMSALQVVGWALATCRALSFLHGREIPMVAGQKVREEWKDRR